MQSIPILPLTVVAIAVLTAQRFGTLGGTQAAAAGNALGVIRTDAVIDEAVTIDVLGTATVDAGGTFAVGAELEVDANGKAVVKTAGVTVARAVTAGVDGNTAEVLLIQN